MYQDLQIYILILSPSPKLYIHIRLEELLHLEVPISTNSENSIILS